MCIRIHIFNLKKQTNRQKNKQTKKQKKLKKKNYKAAIHEKKTYLINFLQINKRN